MIFRRKIFNENSNTDQTWFMAGPWAGQLWSRTGLATARPATPYYGKKSIVFFTKYCANLRNNILIRRLYSRLAIFLNVFYENK